MQHENIFGYFFKVDHMPFLNSLCSQHQRELSAKQTPDQTAQKLFSFKLLVYKVVLIQVLSLQPGTKREEKKLLTSKPCCSMMNRSPGADIFSRNLALFLFFLTQFVWKLSQKAQAKLSESLKQQEIHHGLPRSKIPTYICKCSNMHLVESIIMYFQLTDTWLLAVLDSFPTQHNKNCSH